MTLPSPYTSGKVVGRTIHLIADTADITRLRARGYALGDSLPPTVADEQFHPDDHKVDEVLAYLEDNPDDSARVIAEERAGKARVSILGA